MTLLTTFVSGSDVFVLAEFRSGVKDGVSFVTPTAIVRCSPNLDHGPGYREATGTDQQGRIILFSGVDNSFTAESINWPETGLCTI